MHLRTAGFILVVGLAAVLGVVIVFFGAGALVQYVFAPLLEFVLRLFTGAGR
jgi:hypothetical protein